MAGIQEGIQDMFDQIESSDASSDDTTTTSDSQTRDYHQEMYPSYVPPHKRGHNVQQDKFVNFKKGFDEDKKEGVDNDKYQRLKVPVPFALDRATMLALKAEFPGVYFHCKDNGNHDHPFSHMVTMIGTRFMQRRIRPGKKILDVYGNPNACDGFNTSQMAATEPKYMKALVNRVGPADFIREVNKWGPFFDEDNGVERYHRGSLMSMVHSGDIAEYDVLHLTHTLYYIPMEELAAALHAPGKKRVAYALIHKHKSTSGTINNGEQKYVKKWVGRDLLVKQTNVATGSAYVHPDLTDILFAKDKVWLPDEALAFRNKRECVPDQGLAWELHIVNDETWVVEFVPYVRQELDGVKDYNAIWDDDEALSLEDPLFTPAESDTSFVKTTERGIVVPDGNGGCLMIDIPSKELFAHLRMRCAGKPRTPKTFEDLISTANHLVNPSALFGDKPGMRCPPDKIYDVAYAAFMHDIEKETAINEATCAMRHVLGKHARAMKLGARWQDYSMRDMMSSLKLGLTAIRDLNHVLRAGDPVDIAASKMQSYIE